MRFPFDTRIRPWLVLLPLVLSGCSASSPAVPLSPTSTAPPPSLQPTTIVEPPSTVSPPPQTTATAPPPTNPTATPLPAPMTPPVISTQALIIDHTAVDLFDSIPDEYIQAASRITLLFRHASVGANIDAALNCLGNTLQPRPNYCDRGLEPGEIVYDSKYNRSQWVFEFHSQPNPNPGWWNKESYFIDRVNNLASGEKYDFMGFVFGYVDGQTGSNIDEKFFADTPDDNLPGLSDLEALAAAHPESTMIWWTMNLARTIGSPDAASFNQQLRAYARENGLILMDIADIESHLPDGTACFGIDMQGNPTDIEAICADYTREKFAGHLNAQGSLRMAKAMWVLMARLAGWDGTAP